MQLISQLEHVFIEGAVTKGIDRDIAQDVFDRLSGFGSYSFAKSHAASFAVLVYQSAWLWKYHPLAFFVALLNNHPMGFYGILVTECHRQRCT